MEADKLEETKLSIMACFVCLQLYICYNIIPERACDVRGLFIVFTLVKVQVQVYCTVFKLIQYKMAYKALSRLLRSLSHPIK